MSAEKLFVFLAALALASFGCGSQKPEEKPAIEVEIRIAEQPWHCSDFEPLCFQLENPITAHLDAGGKMETKLLVFRLDNRHIENTLLRSLQTRRPVLIKYTKAWLVPNSDGGSNVHLEVTDARLEDRSTN